MKRNEESKEMRWNNLDPASKVSTILTIVIVLITGLQAYQDRENRILQKEGNEIQSKSIELMQKEFEVNYRPYMSIENIKIDDRNKSTAIKYLMELKNNGHSYATRIDFKLLYSGSDNLLKDMILDQNTKTISPGQTSEFEFTGFPIGSQSRDHNFQLIITYYSNINSIKYSLEAKLWWNHLTKDFHFSEVKDIINN